MNDITAPENTPRDRTDKIKSSLDTRKTKADQRFSNTSSELGTISHEDDLRAMLNRIRQGITREASQDKQKDEQPA